MSAALIAPLIQGGIGIAQSIIGGIKTGKAEKRLERLIDSYQPNKAITDYYSKALQKYNLNPYESASYRMQSQNAQRNLATGVRAMQNAGSTVAGISSLVQGANDANLKAVANAEREQAGALGQLGYASQLRAGEDRYKFENKANLLAMKAGGGAQVFNAGLSNVMGAAGNISNYYTAKELYKDGA